MATNYDTPFYELTHDLRAACPQTAAALESLRQNCSAQTAYYAAFIFICLEARRENSPSLDITAELTASGLQSFTFFERTQAEPQALDLFDAALECYKHDVAQWQFQDRTGS